VFRQSLRGSVAHPPGRTIERDDFSSNRHRALTYSWSMIFFRKAVSAFRDPCSGRETGDQGASGRRVSSSTPSAQNSLQASVSPTRHCWTRPSTFGNGWPQWAQVPGIERRVMAVSSSGSPQLGGSSTGREHAGRLEPVAVSAVTMWSIARDRPRPRAREARQQGRRDSPIEKMAPRSRGQSLGRNALNGRVN
jgi:hypothetical protein